MIPGGEQVIIISAKLRFFALAHVRKSRTYVARYGKTDVQKVRRKGSATEFVTFVIVTNDLTVMTAAGIFDLLMPSFQVIIQQSQQKPKPTKSRQSLCNSNRDNHPLKVVTQC